ncbi:MAG: ABC transporter substrate-binding protein [Bacilli bacterium]|jgi:ABC-type oligopeptide transport system substrate-binding subunit
MTFPKKSSLLIACLAAVVSLSSCNRGNNGSITGTDSASDSSSVLEGYRVTGPYLTGKLAKEVYNAYIGSTIKTLNSAKSQSATDVRHIANFVDGLLMNNEYGILERQLASAASHDENHENFFFTIKEGVPWYTYDGQQYVAKNKLGVDVPQFVTADDFLNSAQIILNFPNGSEIAYMVTLFIDGAWEYYCYTQMLQLIKDRDTSYAGVNWMTLKTATNDVKAEKLMILIAHESGIDISEVNQINGDDLPNVANFSRVGISADGTYGLHYRLNQPARFFPTLLTYAPFYPINRAFFDVHKFAGFGTSKEKMLYNGPFLCSEWSDTRVQYTRNEGYYNKSDVHIKTVNYTVAPDTISSTDMREDYEEGIIDGFSLDKDDAVGWVNYITGGTLENPGTGTIQNPYSDLVNSRELNLIDFTWHFTLNVERPTDLSLQPNTEVNDTSKYPEGTIANTNKALKIQEVRRLILDAIDFNDYNMQNERPGDSNDRYQLNTLTPPGYVKDENDKDYIEYYYEEYANKKGLADAAAAKALVGPQTIAGVNYTQEQVNGMLADARSAIEKYNASHSSDKITYPIVIENAGLAGYAPTQSEYETLWIGGFNYRANGGVNDTPYFKMINNLKATSSTAAETNSYSGYYTLSSWGWIGDYADPLTYLNTYVTKGDMSLFTGTKAPRDNFYLDGDTLVQDPKGMLGEYDEMVNDAKRIYNSDATRYEAFAKAEYHLINDVKLIKPHSMNSQGWAASVSRAAGYENPDAPYGLATYRLTGMWVLVEPPLGSERQVARNLQAQLKAAALAETGTYNYVGSDE